MKHRIIFNLLHLKQSKIIALIHNCLFLLCSLVHRCEHCELLLEQFRNQTERKTTFYHVSYTHIPQLFSFDYFSSFWSLFQTYSAHSNICYTVQQFFPSFFFANLSHNSPLNAIIRLIYNYTNSIRSIQFKLLTNCLTKCQLCHVRLNPPSSVLSILVDKKANAALKYRFFCWIQ